MNGQEYKDLDEYIDDLKRRQLPWWRAGSGGLGRFQLGRSRSQENPFTPFQRLGVMVFAAVLMMGSVSLLVHALRSQSSSYVVSIILLLILSFAIAGRLIWIATKPQPRKK